MEGSQIPVIPAPPTGTVTFLFTDIEGSTRLSQQYPDAMPALLRRHHEILPQAVEVPHVPLRETVELHIIPDLEKHSLEVRIWWQKHIVRALHLPLPTTPVHF